MSQSVEERMPLVEDILGEHESDLGSDYLGYKNHVYRMIHFCFAQHDFTDEERDKIIIAGCFHDIGIWTADTFDYIPPSLEVARGYLNAKGLGDWTPQIESMICEHHKLRRYTGDPLTETFRRGDLVDFSLGFVKCGLAASYVKE